MSCSICLNEVRSTRKNPPIRCGHVFHSCCIQEWKDKGKNTCPVCRKVFDVSQFKVNISVYNNYTGLEDTVQMNVDSIFNVFDIFDITIDVNTTTGLDSILTDLGMSLTDFDSSILHTE